MTCWGYKCEPHEVRFTYADDGLCPACRNRRDSESERAEMGAAAGMDDDERAWRTRG